MSSCDAYTPSKVVLMNKPTMLLVDPRAMCPHIVVCVVVIVHLFTYWYVQEVTRVF